MAPPGVRFLLGDVPKYLLPLELPLLVHVVVLVLLPCLQLDSLRRLIILVWLSCYPYITRLALLTRTSFTFARQGGWQARLVQSQRETTRQCRSLIQGPHEKDSLPWRWLNSMDSDTWDYVFCHDSWRHQDIYNQPRELETILAMTLITM